MIQKLLMDGLRRAILAALSATFIQELSQFVDVSRDRVHAIIKIIPNFFRKGSKTAQLLALTLVRGFPHPRNIGVKLC